MLIGLTGPSQVGKDEVAKILVRDFNFTRVAFADKMKDFLYALDPWITPRDGKGGVEFKEFPGGTWRLRTVVDKVGWERAKMLPEVRGLLQRLGTEAGRRVLGEGIWVNAVDAQMYSLDHDGNYVISDVRFDNEAMYVRDIDGIMVEVTRPGYGPLNDHESESGVELLPQDLRIENSGDLGQLREVVKAMMQTRAWGA